MLLLAAAMEVVVISRYRFFVQWFTGWAKK